MKLNGIFKTSAKEGSKIKLAVACLGREILKEGSFINRLKADSKDDSNRGVE